MARTKQTAEKSTGGKATKQLHTVASRKTAPAARVPKMASVPRYSLSTRTWYVKYLFDRRVENGVIKYHVHWYVKKDERDHSWEPASSLVQFDRKPYMDLVDRWVDGGRKDPSGKSCTFEQFLAVDEFGKEVQGIMEASDDSSCAVLAVKIACGKIGVPFPEEVYEKFASESPPGKELERSMKWPSVQALIKRLVSSGVPIDLPALRKNLVTTSIRGFYGIEDLKLGDGVYLVGAANAVNYGHCFVLHVEGDQSIMFDDNVAPLSTATWIARVFFIRKFQKFAKN